MKRSFQRWDRVAARLGSLAKSSRIEGTEEAWLAKAFQEGRFTGLGMGQEWRNPELGGRTYRIC